MPLFSVLLPIARGPAMLPCAIECVLEQTLSDFELCVICDGAPAETAACAEDYARRDSRVQVFVHAKGERNGEAYRHDALLRSKARYVAQIADDDLWFPNHLAEMETLLSAADFGNLTFTNALRDGSLWVLHGDLAVADTRKQLLADTNNFMGLSHTGYRMDAYRSLPERWAPAPSGVPSDLYMWRKFLAVESLRCATRFAITSLSFPTPARTNETLERRATENRDWLTRIRNPQQRDAIVQAACRSLVDRIVWKDIQVASTASSCMHLDGELRRMARSRAEFQAELARMTASRDEYIGYLGLMTASRDDYQAQLGAMTASHDDHQAQLSAMSASRDDYQAQLTAMTASRDQYISYLGLMTSSRDDYQSQLGAMIVSRDDYQAQLGAMTASRDDYQAQLTAMTASRADYRAQLDAMTASRDDYQAQLTAMTASRDDYQAQLTAMTASRADYRAQLDAMTASRYDYQAQLSAMTASREDYQAQLSEMTMSRDTYRTALGQLTQSISWRLTAPLRALMALGRRGQ